MARPIGPGTLGQKILFLLRELGPKTTRELHDELPPREVLTVSQCLIRLEKQGLVGRTVVEDAGVKGCRASVWFVTF